MSESYSEAEAREIIRRSVLIEEAARAMVALAPGERWEDCDREWYLRDARVALAVFEKALGEATVTPTDDEEPSDAQIEAAARVLLPEGLGPWEKAKPEWQEHARRRARAALRAAGEVR